MHRSALARGRIAASLATLLLGAAACRGPRAGRPQTSIAELRAVSDAYTRAPGTRSADSVVQYFDSAVVVMSPQGSAPVRGIAANRANWARFFRGGNPAHSMTTDTVVVAAAGDMGYSRGHWTVGVDTPNGRAAASGEYLTVWRRGRAGWRIVEISAYPFR